MQANIIVQKKTCPWLLVTTIAGGIALIGGILIQAMPVNRQLILFGLYSIPSHMFISPFPHEPALLYTAKLYSPWLVTIAGTIGCCIAGLFDYWLLIPLLNHRAVRSKFENARLFQKALAFFHKFPFRMLVIASCTPLPFYPFKFLSLADGYPLWKYQLALVVGRVPRFYMLAVLGFMLQPPTWLLVVLAFAGVIVCVLKKLFNP